MPSYLLETQLLDEGRISPNHFDGRTTAILEHYWHVDVDVQIRGAIPEWPIAYDVTSVACDGSN